jgi:hypothetical protein
MPTNQENFKIGALVTLDKGSYYCVNSKRFVPISHRSLGVVVHIFWYDESTYPWSVLGYKFLADVVIGCHKLRDVPNFKIREVSKKDDC